MNLDIRTLLEVSAAAFVGSGLAAILLKWILDWRDRREGRQLQGAREKLERLYTPIFFFTSLNEECFRLCDQLSKALDSDTVKVKDATGNRQSLLRPEEIDDTFKLSNDYVGLVKQNNEQIFKIIRDNWAYVDHEDIDLFRQVLLDQVRLKMEVGPDGKRKAPFLIVQEMEKIFFMRPDFVERIKQRVEEKQRQLRTFGIK